MYSPLILLSVLFLASKTTDSHGTSSIRDRQRSTHSNQSAPKKHWSEQQDNRSDHTPEETRSDYTAEKTGSDYTSEETEWDSRKRSATSISSLEVSEIERLAGYMAEQLDILFEDRTRFDTLSEQLMNIPFDITNGCVDFINFLKLALFQRLCELYKINIKVKSAA